MTAPDAPESHPEPATGPVLRLDSRPEAGPEPSSSIDLDPVLGSGPELCADRRDRGRLNAP